ncbi:MAG: AarF/ABC1/UbiB kinase family protein [Myxococcales bacterium]|nr:AarF/ABC1/UbiB kinase family protein [Myxococcales bacterium]
MSEERSRESRIPAGRLERLLRIGWLAGEAALGGLAERARRIGDPQSAYHPVLSEANAERLTRRLSTLRGAAMKLGQLLSLEGEDFLPPEFSDALMALRADADAMPRSQLDRVLGRAWGRGWQERLEHFDWEPVAAASIGQVHVGRHEGRTLAFKVQYPGVAESIESDVDNLASVFRLARLLPAEVDLEPVIAEAKRQLRCEADYRAEAAALAHYRALMGAEDRCLVPSVLDEWTTRQVLAMDFLPGLPLEDLLGPEHRAAERDRVAGLLLRILFRELFEWRFCQTDPNFANYLYDARNGTLGLLDLGSAREVPDWLSAAYLEIFRAGLANNRGRLKEIACEVGYFGPDERMDRVNSVVDMLELACEPFHRDGYDCGDSDLAKRIRERGFTLAFEQGFTRPPPPETMFLHRKIGGTFLLASRLRARIAGRTLIEPFLA